MEGVSLLFCALALLSTFSVYTQGAYLWRSISPNTEPHMESATGAPQPRQPTCCRVGSRAERASWALVSSFGRRTPPHAPIDLYTVLAVP
jgi:hypothetical protein